MLDKAISIASKAHEGQKDKAGQPYILHPLRLMFTRKKETERICAVLHDVIEDTDITFGYLRNEGFSEEIITVLDALTRRADEAYDAFIERILQSRIACEVKLADLCDNMDLSRIPNPTENDYLRVEKYRKAADRIFESMELDNCEENKNTKEIEINGCVSVGGDISVDEFTNRFIDFIENNYWYFGGGIKEIDGDKEL